MFDDRELVKQVQNGVVDAFRQLVERHQKRVVFICFSFLQNQEDAEDVAQDVFVEVFKSLNSFRGDASFSTWTYRLALNKSIDLIRQKKRKKRGEGIVNSYSQEDFERINVYDSDSIEEKIEKKERRLLLYAAINQLPERQRVAITLSKIEELHQEEVAKIMETSIASVEALLIRAKKRLKELLLKKVGPL